MRLLEKAWYQKAGWLILLWPAAMLFQLSASVRKRFLQSRVKKIAKTPLPVVVIGNITVGGTGKTPLLIWLAKSLQAKGLKPGVISRGYLSKAPHYPFCVKGDSNVEETGDEALLIARNLGCPVVIDPDRKRALDKIVEEFDCDLVLSDDGLQHYGLPRDLEIAVVDGNRLFGNGWCLPAGPLREPVSRLAEVQHVIVNGDLADNPRHPQLANAVCFTMEPTFLINMLSGDKKPFRGAPFNIGSKIQAISGIGNPDRFFDMLGKLPYKLERYDFPDHHSFTAEDIAALNLDNHHPIVMTEKDALKCREFAKSNFWYLAVKTRLPEEFQAQLVKEIKQLCDSRSK